MSPAFMNFLIGFPSNSPSTSSMGILVPISYAILIYLWVPSWAPASMRQLQCS